MLVCVLCSSKLIVTIASFDAETESLLNSLPGQMEMDSLHVPLYAKISLYFGVSSVLPVHPRLTIASFIHFVGFKSRFSLKHQEINARTSFCKSD